MVSSQTNKSVPEPAGGSALDPWYRCSLQAFALPSMRQHAHSTNALNTFMSNVNSWKSSCSKTDLLCYKANSFSNNKNKSFTVTTQLALSNPKMYPV